MNPLKQVKHLNVTFEILENSRKALIAIHNMLHVNVFLTASEHFNIVSNLITSIGASLLKTYCKLKHKSITEKWEIIMKTMYYYC